MSPHELLDSIEYEGDFEIELEFKSKSMIVQGQILDSKEYYAPIITPYEAQLAFTAGAEWTGEYSLEFDSVLESFAGEGISFVLFSSLFRTFAQLKEIGQFRKHTLHTFLDNFVKSIDLRNHLSIIFLYKVWCH